MNSNVVPIKDRNTLYKRPVILKMKWQRKFNSTHLKEIHKQYLEVYNKIFVSVLLWYIYRYSYLNQQSFRHLGFNL